MDIQIPMEQQALFEITLSQILTERHSMAHDAIKLVSSDGEAELNIIANYMNQERPGFSCRYLNSDGVAETVEFPLVPASLVMINRLLLEAEHRMLEFIAQQYVKLEAKQGSPDFDPTDPGNSNIKPFRRK